MSIIQQICIISQGRQQSLKGFQVKTRQAVGWDMFRLSTCSNTSILAVVPLSVGLGVQMTWRNLFHKISGLFA